MITIHSVIRFITDNACFPFPSIVHEHADTLERRIFKTFLFLQNFKINQQSITKNMKMDTHTLSAVP